MHKRREARGLTSIGKQVHLASISLPRIPILTPLVFLPRIVVLERAADTTTPRQGLPGRKTTRARFFTYCSLALISIFYTACRSAATAKQLPLLLFSPNTFVIYTNPIPFARPIRSSFLSVSTDELWPSNLSIDSSCDEKATACQEHVASTPLNLPDLAPVRSGPGHNWRCLSGFDYTRTPPPLLLFPGDSSKAKSIFSFCIRFSS